MKLVYEFIQDTGFFSLVCIKMSYFPGLYIFSAGDNGTVVNNGQNVPVVVLDGRVEKVVITPMHHVVQTLRINNINPGLVSYP